MKAAKQESPTVPQSYKVGDEITSLVCLNTVVEADESSGILGIQEISPALNSKKKLSKARKSLRVFKISTIGGKSFTLKTRQEVHLNVDYASLDLSGMMIHQPHPSLQ